MDLRRSGKEREHAASVGVQGTANDRRDRTLEALVLTPLDVPDFDTGPIVDPTGDRDLLCAAFAWADLQDMPVEQSIAWAQLYNRLAMTVPTATGNAVTEQRLLREGAERGLVAPSQS